MTEQILKLHGLSVAILDALSYESQLGIPLKRNLHYFDKNALIDELVAMSEFFDMQLADYDLAIDYRIKSEESIIHKYERYYPDH